MLKKTMGDRGMQKFIEVVAERKFKQAILSFCQGFSPQDLEFFAERHISVSDALARIGRPPPVSTPMKNLNAGARYILGLPTFKLVALIHEVTPDHARVLVKHPVYADRLLAELKTLLVK